MALKSYTSDIPENLSLEDFKRLLHMIIDRLQMEESDPDVQYFVTLGVLTEVIE